MPPTIGRLEVIFHFQLTNDHPRSFVHPAILIAYCVLVIAHVASAFPRAGPGQEPNGNYLDSRIEGRLTSLRLLRIFLNVIDHYDRSWTLTQR